MKAKKWTCCLLAGAMACSMGFMLVGCDKTNSSVPDGKVKVTWYDGRTPVREDVVDKGAAIDWWTPEKEGYDFKGWFAEASFAQPFASGTKVEKNTAIFSRWRTQTPAPDKRIWYARGSIMNSSWAQLSEYRETLGGWRKYQNTYKEGSETISRERLYFTPVEDAPSNTFEITLDLESASYNASSKKLGVSKKFRFVCNMTESDWTSPYGGTAQMGMGNLLGFEYAAGYNPEKGNTKVERADLYLYGEVHDDDGNLVFYGGYEYNMPAYTWNIYLAPEMGGVWRFTFRSFPGNETTHEVTWERIAYLPHDFVDIGDEKGNGTPNQRCDQCGRTEAQHATDDKPTGPKRTEVTL